SSCEPRRPSAPPRRPRGVSLSWSTGRGRERTTPCSTAAGPPVHRRPPQRSQTTPSDVARSARPRPGELSPMTDNPRALKLADRIKVIVATMIDTRVKDPRLGFVTITDVRVTGDLQHATVFYTVFGSDEEREGTAAALASATGMLRREVGRQTGIRLTP